MPPGSINYDACHAKDAEEIARLRALLQRLEWDKAGYCPLCFPGEAPYRHTEDCPLGRALEGRDG